MLFFLEHIAPDAYQTLTHLSTPDQQDIIISLHPDMAVERKKRTVQSKFPNNSFKGAILPLFIYPVREPFRISIRQDNNSIELLEYLISVFSEISE